jgi:hypothetical protein
MNKTKIVFGYISTTHKWLQKKYPELMNHLVRIEAETDKAFLVVDTL